MKRTLRRLLLPAAALACVLTIGAALIPRGASPASSIADLKVDPFVYLGEVFSNTQPSLQGEFFGFQVTNKVGNKFTGITLFSGFEGSVSSSGKFTAKTVPLTVVSTALRSRRGPGVLGGTPTEISFKGQLSAGGNAVIGTYKLKNETVDKGTFYFLLDED